MTLQTPLPYQAEGVTWLAERHNALLADEPGLGKTLQVIRAADAAGLLKVLVVCPASLRENWRREVLAQRQGDWSVFVTSYTKMADQHMCWIMKQNWCLVVFDEAHYLKTESSQRTRVAYGFDGAYGRQPVPDWVEGIIDRADYVWCLTGTPMPNHAGELYTHLRALAPDRIVSPKTGLLWTYTQFTHRFCEMKFGFVGQTIVGTKNHAELNKVLDGVMLRRLKKDVAKDLPPIRWSEFYVKPAMSDTDLGLEPDVVERIREAIEADEMDSLKRHVDHIGTLRRVTAMAKVKGVIDYVLDFLKNTNEKIVLMAHHRDVIDELHRHKRIRERSVKLHGGCHESERQCAVDRFQQDDAVRVFLGQITAAGTGITLTAASNLLFIEQSWVPGDNAQAAMRIHRIGQENGCHVRVAMLSGSIDEHVQKSLMRKSRDIAMVLGEEC